MLTCPACGNKQSLFGRRPEVALGLAIMECLLPEPSEEKVQNLADRLMDSGIEVRGKTLRRVRLGRVA